MVGERERGLGRAVRRVDLDEAADLVCAPESDLGDRGESARERLRRGVGGWQRRCYLSDRGSHGEVDGPSVEVSEVLEAEQQPAAEAHSSREAEAGVDRVLEAGRLPRGVDDRSRDLQRRVGHRRRRNVDLDLAAGIDLLEHQEDQLERNADRVRVTAHELDEVADRESEAGLDAGGRLGFRLRADGEAEALEQVQGKPDLEARLGRGKGVAADSAGDEAGQPCVGRRERFEPDREVDPAPELRLCVKSRPVRALADAQSFFAAAPAPRSGRPMLMPGIHRRTAPGEVHSCEFVSEICWRSGQRCSRAAAGLAARQAASSCAMNGRGGDRCGERPAVAGGMTAAEPKFSECGINSRPDIEGR